MAIKGSCYCGAVEFSMEDQGEQSRSGVSCLCRTCQKLHTSASYNVKSSPEDVKITKGESSLRTFNDTKADVGKAVRRSFCGECGSHLWSDPDSMEGVRFVKAGPLDNVKDIKHVAEIYNESGLDHTRSSADGLTVYEGMMAKKIKG